MKRIAVLGAGIQGVLASLALARRGAQVDLFDRREASLLEASRWNEGKIHLGHVYANDASGRTAALMARGAALFAPALKAIAGVSISEHLVSDPFVYAVPKSSLLGVDAIRAHFDRVARGWRAVGEDATYFGHRFTHVYEELDRQSLAALYDPEQVATAFRTPERAVQPDLLADMLVEALRAEPRVAFHPGAQAESLHETDGGRMSVTFADGTRASGYDHTVNACWGDRLRLDATLSAPLRRPWANRFKFAVHLRDRPGAANVMSTTFVLGEYGDIVRFPSGAWYLSWYPVCKVAESSVLEERYWAIPCSDVNRAAILEAVTDHLSRLAPGVCEIDVEDAQIEGGVVFAWGSSRISDLSDEVHDRYDVGVRRHGAHFSIDTGKYGLAPMFAAELAEAIFG